MIYVENAKRFKKSGPCIIYVGRTMPGYPESVLGNPFRIGPDGDRDEVIERYHLWLRARWQQGGAVKDELLRLAEEYRLHDLILVCWCAPLACHASVIKDALEGILKWRERERA